MAQRSPMLPNRCPVWQGTRCVLPAEHGRRHLSAAISGGWQLWPESTVTRAVVHVDSANCPIDGTATVNETLGQLPLIRHGGYGAVLSTTTATCPTCGWTVTLDITDTNPRTSARKRIEP